MHHYPSAKKWFYNISCWWKIEAYFPPTLCSFIQIKKRLTFHSPILKVKEWLTILKLKCSQFLGHDCGQMLSAKTDLINPNHQLTKEFKYAILMKLDETQSRKLIIKKYFVSNMTFPPVLREVTKNYHPINPIYRQSCVKTNFNQWILALAPWASFV